MPLFAQCINALLLPCAVQMQISSQSAAVVYKGLLPTQPESESDGRKLF